MKKIYGAFLINVAFMSMQGAQKADLDSIIAAIHRSDLTDVQQQWEELSSTEKQENLAQLKDEAVSVDRMKNHSLLALGSLIWIGATAGFLFAWHSNSIDVKNASIKKREVFMFSKNLLQLIGTLFIKDGIAGLLNFEESSESARVRKYFKGLTDKQ